MNTGGKLSGMDFVRLRLTDLGSVSSFLPGFWVDYKWLSSPGTESFPFVVFQLLSQTPLFTTPWTVAHQAPLSMGSSRQVYRSGLPFPSLGDLPYTRIKPLFPASTALAGGVFTSDPSGKLSCSLEGEKYQYK